MSPGAVCEVGFTWRLDILFQVQHIRTWPCLRLWMFENNPGTGRRPYTDTVDKWPQEQGMKCGVNRKQNMWSQLQGLERGSAWRLWTCGHRSSVWEVTSHRRLWTCDPRYRLLRVGKLWIVWSCDSTIISLYLG